MPADAAVEARRVIGLRGKVISVVDLADRLNLGSGQVEDGKIIILDTPSGQLGVMVDEVDEVLTIASEQLEKFPAAVAKLDERLVMLLDPRGVRLGGRARLAVGTEHVVRLRGRR